MAFIIRPMLGKNTAQINLAGLGSAVGLFAFASGQLLGAHGHTGAIGADIHNRRVAAAWLGLPLDRKSTRLNSSHPSISYAVFCLKKKNRTWIQSAVLIA